MQVHLMLCLVHTCEVRAERKQGKHAWVEVYEVKFSLPSALFSQA